MSNEKTNLLARIRDNQRRLRARRKEYLQELEARLRQYELQGIEASSEIQLAARRVADENRKLRGLLAQHGVGDDSIEAYLQSRLIKGPEAMMGRQFNAAQLSLSHQSSHQFSTTTPPTLLHATEIIDLFTLDELYNNIQYADSSNEDKSSKKLAQEVEGRQNISDTPTEQRNERGRKEGGRKGVERVTIAQVLSMDV